MPDNPASVSGAVTVRMAQNLICSWPQKAVEGVRIVPVPAAVGFLGSRVAD